jgi:hypothetical protein
MLKMLEPIVMDLRILVRTGGLLYSSMANVCQSVCMEMPLKRT